MTGLKNGQLAEVGGGTQLYLHSSLHMIFLGGGSWIYFLFFIFLNFYWKRGLQELHMISYRSMERGGYKRGNPGVGRLTLPQIPPCRHCYSQVMFVKLPE